MECLNSLSCSIPFRKNDSQKQTTLSVWLRISGVALGSIATVTGFLLIFKIPYPNQVGTTIGIVSISIGTCVILAASFLRQKDKKNTSLFIEEPLNQLTFKHQAPTKTFLPDAIPADIWRLIFCLLEPKDFSRCLLACKQWSTFSNDEKLWKLVCLKLPHMATDFPSLVEQGVCTWKQAFRYSPLSLFLSSVEEHEICENKDLLRAFNPYLDILELPTTIVPKFYVRHGLFRFFISEKSQVTVKKGNQDLFTLNDGSDKSLTHLGVEGEMLFAFREDGMVIQWHYPTGRKVNEIQTAFSKKDPSLTHLINPQCQSNAFYVKEGLIVIKYGLGLTSVCEVISYVDPNRTLLIKDEIGGAFKILVKDKKLFVMQRSSIIIWDLQQNKLYKTISVVPLSSYLTDMVLLKNRLLAADHQGKIYEIDLSTGYISLEYSSESKRNLFVKLEVFGNNLYGMCDYDLSGNYSFNENYKTNSHMWAVKLYSKKTISHLNDFSNCKTDADQKRIEMLSRLIKFAKESYV